MFKGFQRKICFLVFFLCLHVVFTTEQEMVSLDNRAPLISESQKVLDIKSQNSSDTTATTRYLQGDIEILAKQAPQIVGDISDILHKETGVQVFINVLKETPKFSDEVLQNSNERFKDRREYENTWISQIEGKYAVIFLFYNDHSLTLKSNLDFLDTQKLLEDYAYPYLPAAAVGSEKYNDGVNEGVSNLYLALAHRIASHYSLDINIPKPLEQPSDVTKVIIYAMLISLLGLFILVRFGILAYKKQKS